MAQVSTYSYDDLPEADVATVLEVPLLWGGSPRHSAPTKPLDGRRGRRGAHAAPPARGARPDVGDHTGRRGGRHRAATANEARSEALQQLPWRRHPVAHTVEIGLISAALVLGVVGASLLALAAWLP